MASIRKDHQLVSQQGPQFSPHSKAKANDKSTNLRKNDVAFTSVYSEKTRLRKCLIMIIIIITEKSFTSK